MNTSNTRRVLTRRNFLTLGGAAAVTATAVFLAWPTEATSQRLTVEDTHQKAAKGEIVLIDIRRPDEWARSGVPEHAIPIDMRRKDFFEAATAAAKGKPIALICARGVRSRRVYQNFHASGLTNVFDVPEGMLGSSAGPGWLSKGLPTVTYDIDR
ncbi:rhodanese-like domain-containing protein [Shimia sp. R11_0]|uniref:rhodanese-like domain-containing protein n=1 Tax=Shimia sp. R11_0 TaxID=2821096 RepID=UPI001AD99004|nr:rhodanese-like domain-containing protein [Shimia sp. R11_0]